MGAVLVSCGLELFLVPNNFLDGGITGISIILTHFINAPLGIFIGLFNIPFIIISYIFLGKRTAVKATIGVISLALCTILLHHHEPVTKEFTLALGYGGLLVGAGVGLALRYGGALDGTEALAVVISQKTNFNIEQIILAINLIIFVIAAFTISPESAMASFLLFYIVVTPIISKVMDGGNEMKTAQIITTECHAIIEEIHQKLNRRVVITQGHKTFFGDITEDGDDTNVKILTVIISRIEETILQDIVEKNDDKAVMVFYDAASIHGGVFRKDKHH